MIQLKAIILFLFFALPDFCLAQHTVLNKGIPGNNTFDLLSRIDKDVLAEEADLVIVMVGTNDMVNSSKLVSYTDFKRNYQQIIAKLKDEQVKVVLMSPPPVDTGYIFKRHNRNHYTEDLNDKLDSVTRIVRTLAKDNDLHFVDLNNVFSAAGSPNREVQSLIINMLNFGKEDGIHPTEQGYQLIAETVYNSLAGGNLLSESMKIICFGDSITYGSYMAGAGTAEGKTYPALLENLIDSK